MQTILFAFVVFAACMLALACGAVSQYMAAHKRTQALALEVEELGRRAHLMGLAWLPCADAHAVHDEMPRKLAFALNQAMYGDAAARARYHAVWGTEWRALPTPDGRDYFPSAPVTCAAESQYAHVPMVHGRADSSAVTLAN